MNKLLTVITIVVFSFISSNAFSGDDGKIEIKGEKNGKVEVELLPGQESFRINSFVRSNIWAVLPYGQSKFKKGQIIDCFFPNLPNKILS